MLVIRLRSRQLHPPDDDDDELEQTAKNVAMKPLYAQIVRRLCVAQASLSVAVISDPSYRYQRVQTHNDDQSKHVTGTGNLHDA